MALDALARRNCHITPFAPEYRKQYVFIGSASEVWPDLLNDAGSLEPIGKNIRS